MSHIPSSAMPRAKPSDAGDAEGGDASRRRAGRLIEQARAHPGIAAAVGVAAAAGLAAAAIPLARSARSQGKDKQQSKNKKKKKD